MNRLLTPALLALATVGLAACGGTAAAGAASATPKPAASPGFGGRNGASGELVRINGMTLVVSAAGGDTTVTYTATTTFQRTSTGSFGDIVAGKCIVATGQKDAAGKVTATTVRLSDAVNGACATGGPGSAGGPPPGGARATPRPRPTPSGPAANFTFVSGKVTAAAGTSITIQPPTGASEVVSVPTSVTVTKAAAATAADLKLHQCLSANGPKATSGTVTARSIAIIPSGPTGCATGGGRGGFGGGGGGGFGGGGGGAPGPPPGGTD